MLNFNKILSLDLGTTKFCISGLRQDKPTDPPKLVVASVPARGMYRGAV